MTKSIRAALALGVAALLPAACGEAPAEQAEAAATAPEGITVANARLMLPAVKGNPGAVYFDVANASDRNMVIRKVEVANVGSAMMHTGDMQEMTQVMVGPGETVKFAPGEQHVMAMDLADSVTAGTTDEVTVTFVGGKTVKFPAEVRVAGDER
jgi:periplasmic copper chaperone A